MPSTGIPRKALAYWPLAVLVVVADWITKSLAVAYLEPAHIAHPFIGTIVQLTLTYNPGTAFGIPVGRGILARGALAAVVVIALIVLFSMYRKTAAGDAWLGAALGLVSGGALGNLIDRLRSARGVVDFIDVRFGAWHFWTFNVADAGVSVGAVLLAIVLWHHDKARTAGRTS
ncbi:MAG TPA: signal peptidase II [Gemmatimonadaceae bacterium]|nr:signal peptidase II [Gemmatimonadaceae bacterium]